MQRVKPYLIVLVLGLLALPTITWAAQKSILISEVQTGSIDSAGDEFVELYNNSAQPIDISGWSLYYKPATGKTWSKKATVTDGISLAGREFWLLSTTAASGTHFASGLSESGGNLQLRNKLGEVVEQFAWGSGDSALGQAAVVAQGGQSMYRFYDEATHEMTNTDNNFSDFDVTNSPTPSAVPVVETQEPDTNPTVYPTLKLSELFPDPATPQSDTADEFIEIYNPTSSVVSLDGWKLRDDSGKEFVIKAKTIAAQGYAAFYITETGITLNNTGDTVTLINPIGDEADQSADYGSTKEGASWSLVNGEWNWVVTPTPGNTNATELVEVDDFSPVATISKVKKAATKKPTTRATTPKTSKAGSAKKSSSSTSKVGEQADNQVAGNNWWTWLLITLGVGTIGYGIYEYRSEIQLFFKKLSAKLGFGRKAS